MMSAYWLIFYGFIALMAFFAVLFIASWEYSEYGLNGKPRADDENDGTARGRSEPGAPPHPR